jgi:CubicO group peptidase (beta-lactamase class C family)
MNKILISVILPFAFLFSSCESALLGPEGGKQPEPKKYASGFDTMLDSLRYSLDVPALAGAIVTDSGVIYSGAVGCRRYGGAENVTATDRFHLGSCGKSFTAVLIGTLVDEGLVNWNTTLPEIFPEYKDIMRDEYKDVTVSDILCHAAGFKRDYSSQLFHSTDARGSRVQVVAWALKQPPAQKRGSVLYSNLGFIIAGAIAEKIKNRPYEELLTERVLQPLGLKTAGFGTMGTPGLEDQPLQHTANHAPIIAEPTAGLDPSYDPAGGLYMSVGDWGKYIQWVMKAEAGKSQGILTAATAKRITSGGVYQGSGSYYAYGWGIGDADWAGGKSMNHSGSNGFNYSTVMVSCARHYAVIVMSNQGAIGQEWPLGPAFWRLQSFYLKGI